MKHPIATTLEQSRKLIELGISPVTADMCWDLLDTSEPHVPLVGNYSIYEDEDCFLPAWSLPALLNLLPPYLFEFERGIDLNIYPSSNGKSWHVSYMPNNPESMKTDKFRQITNGDTLIEAVYNMIVWLTENSLIHPKSLRAAKI